MGSGRAISGMPGQHEAIGLHDAQNPLPIDRRQVLVAAFPVEQGRDAPITVTWPLIGQPADRGQDGDIFSLRMGFSPRVVGRGPLRLLRQVGAGNTKRVSDRFHGEPSLSSEASRKTGFLGAARASDAIGRVATETVRRGMESAVAC